jgi:NAD(P)-dependent dehydrogenase (short-subunit alcohol dehydrogenase family)
LSTREENWLGLSGKTALVTGAASGIGLAITRALLSAGVAVELVDRNPEVADVAAKLATESGVRTAAHVADVRDRASLERVRDALRQTGRTLDVLVPNAGVNVRKPLVELSDSEVDTIVETNLTGVIATMQVFAPLLFGRDGASIVVTSSAAAEHGMVLRAVYSATKAGTSGLTRSAAIEWGPHGVRVNAVAPGVIRTPLTQAYMDQFPEREKAATTQVPLGRVGTPEEVADVVVMLAGRPTRFMTGQTLFIDGGLTAGTSWW